LFHEKQKQKHRSPSRGLYVISKTVWTEIHDLPVESDIQLARQTGRVFFLSVKTRSFVTFEKATVENEKEISDEAGACPTWANGQTARVQSEGSHFISELQKSVIVTELELSDVLMTYRRGLFGTFIHENVKKRNKNIPR
jgi:hypothetical protein